MKYQNIKPRSSHNRGQHSAACHVHHISSNTSRVSNKSRGLTANTIELIVLVHMTVVRCVIRDVLQYVMVDDNGIRKFKEEKKLQFKIKIRGR